MLVLAQDGYIYTREEFEEMMIESGIEFAWDSIGHRYVDRRGVTLAREAR